MLSTREGEIKKLFKLDIRKREKKIQRVVVVRLGFVQLEASLEDEDLELVVVQVLEY